MTKDSAGRLSSAGISRRNMLKGAGLVGTGLAAVGLLGAPQAMAAGADGKSEPEWTDTTDLLVIGTGAGILCGVGAKKEGIDCILLEKDPQWWGGSTFLSGGGMWMPGNYPCMEAAPEEYKQRQGVETLIDFMNGGLYRGITPFGEDMEEYMFTNMPKAHDTAVSRWGMPWTTPFPVHDYQKIEGWSGNRVVLVDGGWGNTRDAIGALGLDIRLGTTATKLLTDESGRVIGVQAKNTDGDVLNFRANNVIVAAGPFDRNPNMVNAFLPVPLDGSVVSEGCTGDGIRMCMELGADLANMTYFIATPCILPTKGHEGLYGNITELDPGTARMFPHSIVVNDFGVRVCNESTTYTSFGDSMMNIYDKAGVPKSNRRLTFICDSQYVNNYGMPKVGAGYVTQANMDYIRTYDTIEALCEAEGIDTERFLEQLDRFNGFCDDGIDRDFGRGESGWDDFTHPDSLAGFSTVPVISELEPTLKNPMLGRVEQGPFYAMTYGVGSYSTNGGMRVNKHNQVTRDGEPIPGLYAVGVNAAMNYFTGGMAIGWGFWGAVNALNHAYNLDLF